MRRIFPAILLLAISLRAQPAFTVVAWGDNPGGVFAVPALRDVTQVAAGEAHVVAVTADGRFVAWGRNEAGQTNVPAGFAVPVPDRTGAVVTLLAAGPRHSVGWRNGALASWGAVTAVPDTGRIQPLALAAGGDFNLALTPAGRVVAAGDNASGQSSVPAAATQGVIAIAAGGGHALALKADGTLVAWGRNDFGQATIPATVKQVVAIAAGPEFSVAARSDGVVIAWGRDAEILRPPAAAGGALELRAGRDFVVGKIAGSLVVWGAAHAPLTAPAGLGPTVSFAAGDGFVVAVTAPFVTREPGIVHVTRGGTIQMSADLSDETGATFSWGRSSLVPPLASGKTLTLSNVGEFQGGGYTLTVTYPTGFTQTLSAIVIVDIPPTITRQPSASRAVENEVALLTVEATGTPPLGYQWKKDGLDVPGADFSRFELGPLNAASTGRYACVVSNASGTVESTAVLVTVQPAPNGRENTFSPVELGETIALRARTGNNTGPFGNFQWTRNGVSLPGINGPELVLTNFAPADAGDYVVTFTDGSGLALTTFFRPYLQTEATRHAWISPNYVVARPTAPLTFTLAGQGDTRGLIFTWTIDNLTTVGVGVDLTSITLSPPSNLAPQGETHTLQVFLGSGNTRRFIGDADYVWAPTINPGTIVRVEGPGARTSNPVEVPAGRLVEMKVTFESPIAMVTWTKNFQVIAGQTSTSLAMPAMSSANDGEYSVYDIPGSFGNSTSWKLKAVSTSPVAIVQQPAAAAIPPGGTAALTVRVTAPLPASLLYRWFRNGQEYALLDGGTTHTLNTRLPGVYHVNVYHGEGTAQSAAAVVTGGATGSALRLLQPGIYLGSTPGFRGAAYVRANQTIAIAARADDSGVGWFGEASTAQGNFFISEGLRNTGGRTPLARDPSLPLTGGPGQSFSLETALGPFVTQGFLSDVATGAAPNGREGFFRATLPGTSGGEIWVFVGPPTFSSRNDNPIAIFLHDGFVISNGSAQFDSSRNTFRVLLPGVESQLSSLDFTPDLDRVVLNLVARDDANGGRFAGHLVALRDAPASDARLANLSVRAEAGVGDQTLIAGFVTAGSSPRGLLLRGIGPELTRFDVPGVLADPSLHLYRDGVILDENDNWGTNRVALAPAFARTGAFTLADNSRDAALLANVAPGAHTAQIHVPATGPPGVALVELYEDGGGATRLVNLSARSIVRTGKETILGFVITGTQPRRMLVRAVGPTLAAFQVNGSMPDPQLRLMRDGAVVASNDNWSDDPDNTAVVSTAALASGAFPLPLGSTDAATLATLAPGAYTAVVTGSASGVVLVEAYEVP